MKRQIRKQAILRSLVGVISLAGITAIFIAPLIIGTQQQSVNSSHIAIETPRVDDPMPLERRGSRGKEKPVNVQVTASGFEAKPRYFRSDLSLSKEGVSEVGLSEQEKEEISGILERIYNQLLALEVESVEYVENEGESYCLLNPLGEKMDALISEFELLALDVIGEEKAATLSHLLTMDEQMLEARDKYREIAAVDKETRVSVEKRAYPDPTTDVGMSIDQYTFFSEIPLDKYELVKRYSHLIDFHAILEKAESSE